jgi:uncharacterized membrane protein YkoI
MSRKIAGLAAAVGLGAALVLGAGIVASASERGEAGKYREHSEYSGGGSYLPVEEIVARLKQRGYTDIYEIERERGAYEVKARGPEGRPVELYLDPRTGEVIGREHDD